MTIMITTGTNKTNVAFSYSNKIGLSGDERDMCNTGRVGEQAVYFNPHICVHSFPNLNVTFIYFIKPSPMVSNDNIHYK
jgi:hypothetical protein